MPLETEALPLAAALAITFTIIFLVIILLVSLIGKAIKRKKEGKGVMVKEQKSFVVTTGEQLDRFFLYAVYIVIFEVIGIFLMLSFFALGNELVFADAYPLAIFVAILIYGFLMVVDWSKLRSKRRPQREMREV